MWVVQARFTVGGLAAGRGIDVDRRPEPAGWPGSWAATGLRRRCGPVQGGKGVRLRDMTVGTALSIMRIMVLRARLGRRIEVGFDTQVGPGCRVVVAKGGLLKLRGTTLSRSVALEVSPNAVLSVGRTFVGPGSILSARESVTIGDDGAIAEYVTVRDHNHLYGPGHSLMDWEYTSAPVVIGDGAWLASKVTVVAGVRVGEYGMCAAGAVVTRDVGPGQRVGGVPARPLGPAGSETDVAVNATQKKS